MRKKKYLAIALCVLAMFLVTGCNVEKYRASAVVKGAEGTMEGTIFYTPEKELYFNIHNNTDRGCSYSLIGTWEKYESNEWKEVFTNAGSFFSNLMFVEAGETAKSNGKNVNLGYCLLEKNEKLSQGKYRVRFDVIPDKANKWDNSTIVERTENISFEFEVK